MKVNIGKYLKGNGNRKISVEIHDYDTYSMDHTLAHIILPMLIQLKETKHGVPHDFAEVGGESHDIQSSFDFYSETVDESFDKKSKEWDVVLDKMIWSFEQLIIDDYDSKYFHGKAEYDWVKTDKTFDNPITNKTEETYQMIYNPFAILC